jgi:Protein of unknown function (DUF3106)
MSIRLQLVRWALGVTLCGVVCLPCTAQRTHFVAQQRPPKAQNPKPPKPAKQNQTKPNPNRPPTNQEKPATQTPPTAHQNPGAETGANSGAGANNNPNRNLTPRQQLGVGAPRPWLQKMREMPPAQRERFFQNSPAFQRLAPEQQNKIRQQFNQWDRMSPQQRADQVEKEGNWQSLSPEQKSHIKNDVLPAWRQMSPDRRQAIQQRLRVLQNMPESARNQRLNDPKFTEGMSEDDKSMLRDLSHLHQGGAPDPPGE